MILGLAPAAQAPGRDFADKVKAVIAVLNVMPRTIELTSKKHFGLAMRSNRRI
jgi:hypothetical protein